MFSRKFSGLNLGKKSRSTEPRKNVRFDPNLDFTMTFSRHRSIPHVTGSKQTNQFRNSSYGIGC